MDTYQQRRTIGEAEAERHRIEAERNGQDCEREGHLWGGAGLLIGEMSVVCYRCGRPSGPATAGR